MKTGMRRRRSAGRGQWCEVAGDRSALRPLGGTEDGAPACLEMLRFLGADFRQENFLVVWLDARCRPIGGKIVSVGTLTAALVHPREVFADAIERRAAHIVLAHNHPSMDPKPSEEDFALSDRMEEVGRILGIPVLDSIVVVPSGLYSSCSRSAERVDTGRLIDFAETYGKRTPPGPGGADDDDGDRCLRCGHPFSAHRFASSGFAVPEDHGCPE